MQPLTRPSGHPVVPPSPDAMPFSLPLFSVGGLLLFATASCHHSADGPSPVSHCAGAGQALKTVTGVVGTVRGEYSTRNYALVAPRAGSATGIDVGILCDSLPHELTTIGQKVRFSGTYHYRPGVASGDTLKYYLTLSQVVRY